MLLNIAKYIIKQLLKNTKDKRSWNRCLRNRATYKKALFAGVLSDLTLKGQCLKECTRNFCNSFQQLDYEVEIVGVIVVEGRRKLCNSFSIIENLL